MDKRGAVRSARRCTLRIFALWLARLPCVALDLDANHQEKSAARHGVCPLEIGGPGALLGTDTEIEVLVERIGAEANVWGYREQRAKTQSKIVANMWVVIIATTDRCSVTCVCSLISCATRFGPVNGGLGRS